MHLNSLSGLRARHYRRPAKRIALRTAHNNGLSNCARFPPGARTQRKMQGLTLARISHNLRAPWFDLCPIGPFSILAGTSCTGSGLMPDKGHYYFI
jgi:hypothetical protein